MIKTKLSKVISLCALLLVFISVFATLSFENAFLENKNQKEVFLQGYEVTIDGKTICILENQVQAQELVDSLIEKAQIYYRAEKNYAPVNEIEIKKGSFNEKLFFTKEQAVSSFNADLILGKPTVVSTKGEEITLSLSETVFCSKLKTVDFETEINYVYGVSKTYEKVISEGKAGVIKQIYETNEIDGVIVSDVLFAETVIEEPENKVIEIGVTPSMQLASNELAFFIKPYDGKISSDYGYRNFNGGTNHSGIDIVAKSGSCNGKTAVAAADGIVVESGYSSTRGNYIILKHDFGFTTVYMHFKKRLVAKGDVVKAGDPIGLIGSTGRSTGPHLHFEIRLNGKTTDPENYLSFK